MKKNRPTSLLLILAAWLVLSAIPLASPLAADDLAFHEAGARAASLGGAFTARADDTAALFYNPAGLAFLPGLRFKTNITLGSRVTNAAWPGGGPSWKSNPYEILGGHALSWQPFRRVTVATGLFPVATFNASWNQIWSGRTEAVRTDLYIGSFRSAIAVEVVKGLAVSAGVDVLSSSLIWNYRIPLDFELNPLPEPVNVESRNRLEGHGVGFVAGALWKIIPAVQVGASYRKAVGLDLEGRGSHVATLWTSPLVPAPDGDVISLETLVQRFYENQMITGRQTVPREITCGLALTPLARLSLYADLQWTRWSEFGQWTFRSTNADGVLAPDWTTEYEEFYGITPDYGTQSVPFALEDTRTIKTAVEYRPFEHIAVRAGYARHESSVAAADRSPLYPDLDRNIYSLGFGYEGPVFSIWRNSERIADLSFDAFARYSSAAPQGSAYPGFEMTYSSKRFTWGVGVGFSY
jgi:long-chain fatty acid transport protein